MADDSGNSPLPTKPGSNGSNGSSVNTRPASLSSAPPGFHPVRRSLTVDDSAQLRQRPASIQQPSFDRSFDSSPLRRRSSTFSDYSLNEARRNLRDDILNPGGAAGMEQHASSDWSWLPLAFALLPAVSGLFFKNGSSLVTDIMLLGLAAVFLHWSVTQPWIWYHSAQEVRVREETMAELAMEDDSDGEATAAQQKPVPPSATDSKTLDHVPEEDGENGAPPNAGSANFPPSSPPADVSRASRQAALNELYAHEIMALASCLVLPALAAYLLHAIRGQLSRPSEGLVSDYNLTIFLLAAEIHPLSHLLKLLRARTLHLQRIVNTNPYHTNTSATTAGEIQDMARRLAHLEALTALTGGGSSNGAATPLSPPGVATTPNNKQYTAQQTALLVREVRNAIQPELDALNRAVRRYEKKATVLAFQTESRFGALDARLNDAISLAAAAAKNSAAHGGGFVSWVAALAVMPLRAAVRVAVLPFRAVSSVFLRRDGRGDTVGDKGEGGRDRGARGGRAGTGGVRMGAPSDRIPSRLSKR